MCHGEKEELQSLKPESHADYVALSYLYNFMIQMDAVFSEWTKKEVLSPETKQFVHEVERSFSEIAVLFYQNLNREQQFEKMEIPESSTWPKTFVISLPQGLEFYDEEIKPFPCWIQTE